MEEKICFIIMVLANKLPMYMKKIIQGCKSFLVVFCICTTVFISY